MSGIQTCFRRYEKKYLLSAAQYEALRMALMGRMAQDAYGLHTICNLYMDTEDYALIRASIDKPVYKEKLRLRSYGIPAQDGTVFLELKKKYKGVVYKRRIALRHREAAAYLMDGTKPRLALATPTDPQIWREIECFQSRYGNPTPKAFIAYDRTAYAGDAEPGLRITFDENIRFRATQLDLTRGAWGTGLLGKEQTLMEIKAPGAMPLWLCHVLCDLEIHSTSFSKYGTGYKTILLPQWLGKELAHVS